jgi:hypothetical protein
VEKRAKKASLLRFGGTAECRWDVGRHRGAVERRREDEGTEESKWGGGDSGAERGEGESC